MPVAAHLQEPAYVIVEVCQNSVTVLGVACKVAVGVVSPIILRNITVAIIVNSRCLPVKGIVVVTDCEAVAVGLLFELAPEYKGTGLWMLIWVSSKKSTVIALNSMGETVLAVRPAQNGLEICGTQPGETVAIYNAAGHDDPVGMGGQRPRHHGNGHTERMDRATGLCQDGADIFQQLKEKVWGQDQALMQATILVYSFLKNASLGHFDTKFHFMIEGQSGCGKSTFAHRPC